MSDDELLSDIDISDDGAAKAKTPPPKDSPKADADGDAKEKSNKNAEKGEKKSEGDKASTVFAELFGAQDEEESSEELWGSKPAKAAEPKDAEAKKKKEEDDSVDRLIDGADGEEKSKEDNFVEGEKYADSDDDKKEAEEAEIELPTLRLRRDPLDYIPEGARVTIAKPPSTMGVQSVPFDESLWDGNDIKPETENDPLKLGRLKVKRRIHDMIRWRINAFGQKESNAKFVEFDDGSLVLFIGDEPYIVDKTQLRDSRHLFVQQTDDEGATFLECDAPIRERFTLIRSNVAEVAQHNLSVRMRALQKNKSTSKIVQHSVADILADKEEKEKAEAAQAKLAAFGRHTQEPQLTADFLERDDDELGDAYSRRFTDEDERANRLRNAKRMRDEDVDIVGEEKEEVSGSELLDDEDLGLFEDDDDDERPSKKAKK